MAPVQMDADYYAVLEISNSATLEEITKSYRRLARIRHPDKNLNDDNSTAAFQLVSLIAFPLDGTEQRQQLTGNVKLQNAYTTISNTESRRVYDTRWAGIRDSLRAQQEEERRRTEASGTEEKRTADESAKKQKEEDARKEYLRRLELSSSGYVRDLFDIDVLIGKLTADLQRLRDRDAEALRKERERNSWWAYLTSSIHGNVNETDEQKQARKMEHLHRLASKTIKESELHEQKAKFQRLWDAFEDVKRKIACEREKVEAEAQARAREKQVRMAQEKIRREKQEMYEYLVKLQKEQAERAAKEAREVQAAREAQERASKAAAAERTRREVEEREQAKKAAEEVARKAGQTAQKAKKARKNRPKPAIPSQDSSHASASARRMCRHDMFWPKVEGRHHLCSNCHVVQRRFAFECPGCGMIACASCRRELRGGKS